MGEELTRKPGGLTLPNQGSPDPGRTGGPGKAGGNSRTGKPGTERGPDSRTGGTPGRTETGKEPKKEVPGLPSVTEPAAPVPEQPKKAQRRKPRKTKKDASFNADQISALILTGTTIVASRPGMEVWQISQEEANQLAAPIANMIEKSEKLKEMSEHADAIALVTASIMIFGPRAFAYAQIKKQKELQRTGGARLVRTDKQKRKPKPERKEQEDAGSNGQNVGESPSNGSEPSAGIFDAIPGTII